jgi:hypothetical protein
VIELDQARTARPPAVWSGELVRQRLVEAFSIERRMPQERFRAVASSWPGTPMHSFADVVGWDNAGDGASDRVLQNWARAKGVYSWEVSRMDEAIDWLRWLDVIERRQLAAWAVAKARGIPVRKVMRREGWHPTTFYRATDKAAQRIADRLNAEGVTVR